MPGNVPSSPDANRTRAGLGARILYFIAVIFFLLVGSSIVASYISSDFMRLEAAALPPVIAVTAPPPIPAVIPADPLAKPKAKAVKLDKDRKLINAFFVDAQIPTLSFEFDPENWEYLKKDARRYAEAKMIDEDGKVSESVAVKCKGSAGSFQGPEQKPGLTISMKQFKGAERWRGFAKWHLNNGAQDGTYLQEKIAGEIARKAGVPASRCGHALVKIQGRDVGLYVFKEAFDKDFLVHFFSRTDGDLYDGGFVSEIRPEMEKDEGDPKDLENIKELIAACKEGDQQKRWARLEKILDIDKFISYLSLESILSHWDGYSFNRNNYRLYFDPETGKAVFFLHGMDQTFGDANFPILRDPGAMVGQAVLSNPAWKALYRERAEEIYLKVLKPIDWPARVVEVGEKVKAALAEKNPQAAKDYQNRINEARDRVSNRIAAIGKQLGDMPKPLKFDANGITKLPSDGWRQQGSAAQVDSADIDGKQAFHIRADGDSFASWRKPLTLEPGKYRFEARVRTAGVVSSPGGTGEGAGVRISGGSRGNDNALKGDNAWKQVSFEFTAPGNEVVLVAELRASKGEVWFDKDSLQLVRVKQ